jgi:hypothetical protein
VPVPARVLQHDTQDDGGGALASRSGRHLHALILQRVAAIAEIRRQSGGHLGATLQQACVEFVTANL